MTHARVTSALLSAAFLLALVVPAPADPLDHSLEDQLAAEAAAFELAFGPAPAAAAPNPGTHGSWGQVIPWTPHIPVTVALLPDGRLLTFSSNQRTTFPSAAEFTYAAVWNPATGIFTEINNNRHDMFCGGTAMLPDGRLVINGGRNSTVLSSIFDYRTNQWSAMPDMHDGRWYNTSVALTDGSVFTVSGSGGPDTAERWNSNSGWRRLTGINWAAVTALPGYINIWHPFIMLAPNGNLFHFGPTDVMNWINPDGLGSMAPSGQNVPGLHYPKEGSIAMYGEGRILVAGGGANPNPNPGDPTTGTSSNLAYTVDLNGPAPVVTTTASMQFSRQFANSVILPNGEVMIIGGNTSGIKFSDGGSILTPEIWNPQTRTWRPVADMAIPRNYHSAALLLPDGRVWSGGGGLSGGETDHQDAQIFTPPTLFNADGSPAARPAITQGPAQIGLGARFTVLATPGITKFAFIKMSAQTHSIDTDLRYLELGFTELSPGNYQLTAQSNRNVLTPGFWMLFALNSANAHSVARIIQVTADDAPSIAFPGDQLNVRNTAATLQIVASLPSGANLTYAATGLPAGLSISTSTGFISGTVTAPAAVYAVTVTVTSPTGLTASTTFNWTVLLTNGGSGQISREWWLGVPGRTIAELTNSAAYPDNPTGRDLLTSFETPTDWGSDFGQRVRGYVFPPVTGLYRFWIASDDEARLLLSTDATAANARTIATVPNWTLPREWMKFLEQSSVLIPLVAGERYYIEALMKERDGGDHLSVAWALPGTDAPVLIAGQHLAPFNSGTSIPNRSPILTTPGNQSTVAGSPVSLAIQASDPDGDTLTFSATGLPAGLAIAPATGIISGSPTSTGTTTVTVTATDGITTPASISFSWIITAIGTPVIANPGEQVSPQNSSVNLQIVASAPSGTLTYTATGLPTGLSISASTGRITGTVSAAPGVYPVTVNASASGLTASASFNWTVQSAIGGPGQISREWWLGVPGRLITALTSNPAYPNNPSGSDLLTSFEAPADWANDYGQRVRGYLTPPSSGQYRFWIASDDESRLLLSTDANPANATAIANVPGWSNPREWTRFPAQTSALITLVAGQRYYIEALMKEGDGGDHLAVAWATPGTTTPVVIAGQFLEPFSNGAPAPNRSPILTSPGSQSNVVGTIVSLAIQASDPDGDTLTFSATGLPAGLAIAPATGVISGSPTSTGTATVTVSATDGITTPASIFFSWTISATGAPVITNPGAQTTAQNLSVNLQIVASAPSGTLTYTATGLPSALSISASTGLITGTVTAAPGDYPVTVNATASGLTASASFNWTVQAPIGGAGQISREWWLGVPGRVITALTSNPAYPNNPSGNDLLTSFEAPADWANDYGQRVRGYLTPPTSGQYRFWIAGDDESRLLLSTDANPANATAIASVPGWSNPREWTRFPAQTSALITLVAGQRYYIEALMKEGDGGDHLAVAWARPGTTTPVVIAGQFLQPFRGRSPVITSPGNQNSFVGSTIALAIQVSDPDGDAITFSATGLPAGVEISTASGVIFGSPTTAGTSMVTVSATDGLSSPASISFTWTIQAGLTLDPLSGQPRPNGTSVDLTSFSQGGTNPRYQWTFGDGSGPTAWSTSPSISHTFPGPGRYLVTVAATDDTGRIVTRSFNQGIHAPITARRPSVSGAIAYETRPTGNGRIWVINPDNDTVSVFDAVTRAKLAEPTVGTAPRALAIAPDGRVWVTCADSSTISILSNSSLAVTQTIGLPRGSRPFGVGFDQTHAWVAMEGTGRLLRLTSTGSQAASIDVGLNARHVSVSGDGARVYVSRFITPRVAGEATASITTTGQGGEVVVVSTASLTVERTIILAHSERLDGSLSARGIPNYLGATAISPDGLSAWVPSKQDNIRRGMLRSGQQLTHETAIRAIASRINLATQAEDHAARVDFDNAGMPSAICFDPWGIYAFTAIEASRSVAVIDVWNRREIVRFNVGRAPQGLTISPEGTTLFVHNFMDRTVTVHDVTGIIRGGSLPPSTIAATLNCVATERLSPQILLGKQHFYDARDPRLALQEYMSCATCHNDGGQDGRIWDFTGFGEGLRNTIALRGAGTHGTAHWSGNFDEVQDFEIQIRNLAGGTGLIAETPNPPLGAPNAGRSADLDALAAYVTSLTTVGASPSRATAATLPTAALDGRNIFKAQNCASCHSGAQFTNSALNVFRDVGTIRQPTSGQRLGAALNGLDVPTLRGLWLSAPYLHDGSAATIADAIRAHSGVSLSTSDLTNLASYISNIDDAILSAPAPLSVTLATPLLTVSSSFSVSATFSGPATGFTSSDIAVANGTLGTLTGSGATYTFTVTPTGIGTVTVSVGAGVALDTEGAPNLASNTLSLSYQLNRPPVIMAVGTQTTVRGQSANPVQIAASDPDGQPLSYSVTGLPSGLSISATGLISGTVSSSAASSNTVTVTVSDGSLTASTSFTWNTTAPQGLALTGRDIGTPGAAGSNSLTAGVYTVSGSGNDIWGSSDNFRFVSQSFAGDGEIIVRVTSQTSTDPWAKAGLMFRETLTAGSRHALVALTPGNGIAFQYRTTTAGSSGDAGSRPAAPAPNNWLRLTRRGDVFTGYQSTDGINWTTVGNVTIPMSAVINVGLCVTSHYDGLLSTAVFDNLQLGL